MKCNETLLRKITAHTYKKYHYAFLTDTHRTSIKHHTGGAYLTVKKSSGKWGVKRKLKSNKKRNVWG